MKIPFSSNSADGMNGNMNIIAKAQKKHEIILDIYKSIEVIDVDSRHGLKAP